MDIKQIPLLVVISGGDESQFYEQPRETINPKFLKSDMSCGEISWSFEDKEILIIDPLKQQGG